MGLFKTIWVRWRKIDQFKRIHIKQTITWITAYMICTPALLTFMIIQAYNIQTDGAIKASMPEEVTEENYQKWLIKQQQEGRFFKEERIR
jgi:hypothetical protein